MAKPDKHIGWLNGNEDAAERVEEPSSERKLNGYFQGETPASRTINWVFYYADLWNRWAEEQNDLLAEGGGGSSSSQSSSLTIAAGSPAQPELTLGSATETSIRDGSIANNLLSVAYGGGRFVAVLQLNKLITSSDGASWSLADLSAFTISQFNEVRYLNGMFIAVGDDDLILYSADGVDWEQATVDALAFTYRVRGVGFGGGRFAACGQRRILSSYDGINWATETESVNGLNLISIEYGNGIWVAVGLDGAFTNAIVYTSTDLVTWTERTSNYGTSAGLERVRFHNSIFNAVGRGLSGTRPASIRSTDGITWDTAPSVLSSGQARDLCFYGGTWFMATGNSPARILVSTNNGETWAIGYTLTFGDFLYGIVKGPDGILAVSGEASAAGPYVVEVPTSLSPEVNEGDVYINSENGYTAKIQEGLYSYQFNFLISGLDAVVNNLQVNGQISSPIESISSPGATETIDWSNGNVQSITLNADCTLTLDAAQEGAGYVLVVKQDGTGGHTVTWPGNVLWAGGTPPTLSAGADEVDVISLLFDGVNYYGNAALAFA